MHAGICMRVSTWSLVIHLKFRASRLVVSDVTRLVHSTSFSACRCRHVRCLYTHNKNVCFMSLYFATFCQQHCKGVEVFAHGTCVQAQKSRIVPTSSSSLQLSCFYLHHWILARRSGWSDANSKRNTSTFKFIANTKNKHIISVVKKNKIFLDCMAGS